VTAADLAFPDPARGERRARWISAQAAPPSSLESVDDGTPASAALARARAGAGLAHLGDYHNARALLAAMGRRLAAGVRERARAPADTRALFLAERRLRLLEHDVLSRLAVPAEPGWRITLRRAPDVAAACEGAFGPHPGGLAVVPLRELLGAIGAHEWRRKGVPVPALGARVHPHHGVYAPVRGEYVDLVAEASRGWPGAGRDALDVGTGTGVLAILLARAGARVVATDDAPVAVACARENAARLGVADRVEVVLADLFPPAGRFDLVVSNPPWLPADAVSPLERAVYDSGGRFLARLVAGLPERLRPGGEAWIVLSDLAERLGLRPRGHLEALAREAGLAVIAVAETRPTHPRAADPADPLHAARRAEVTRLYRLRAAGDPRSP
jgi:methylase of polypeptide subunit release factors